MRDYAVFIDDIDIREVIPRPVAVIYPHTDKRDIALKDERFSGCPYERAPDDIVEAVIEAEDICIEPLVCCPLNDSAFAVFGYYYKGLLGNRNQRLGVL